MTCFGIPPGAALSDTRIRLIAESYLRLTGKPLVEDAPDDSAALGIALWQAPRAIVAHGTEPDPVFFYGNCLALQVFEMDFAAFTVLPSRHSAESLERAARARLLERVAQQGYVEDYSGVRVASSGTRFMISDAAVWNLVDEDGICHGQAAAFADWRLL